MWNTILLPGWDKGFFAYVPDLDRGVDKGFNYQRLDYLGELTSFDLSNPLVYHTLAYLVDKSESLEEFKNKLFEYSNFKKNMPEIYELYVHYNKPFPLAPKTNTQVQIALEDLTFLSEYAQELSGKQIYPESVALLQNKERLQLLYERMVVLCEEKWLEIDKRNGKVSPPDAIYAIASMQASELLFSHIGQVHFLEKLLNQPEIFKEIYDLFRIIELEEVIRPSVFFEVIVPFAQLTGLSSPSDLRGLVFVAGQKKLTQIGNITSAQRALWNIIHGQNTLAHHDISLPRVSLENSFNPAALLMYMLDGPRDKPYQLGYVPSVAGLIQQVEKGYEQDKVRTRMRDILHTPNHLENRAWESLFEIFRNAWQATARSGGSNDVRVKDGYTVHENKTYYTLSMRDYVGMDPREALKKLLIPGEGEGMHGVHFLTVLRDADIVEVKTSIGGKIGVLLLFPKKEGKEVVGVTASFTELEQDVDSPFKGTEVNFFVTGSMFEIQTQSAIVRQRIEELAQAIPTDRARIILNETTLNTNSQVAITKVSTIGRVEIKASEHPGTNGISVDDIPVSAVSLQQILETSLIPEAVRRLFSKNGVVLNMVNSPYSLTRDHTGFVYQEEATTQIQTFLQDNYQEILLSLLASGQVDPSIEIFPGENLIPKEFWSDPRYAVELSSKSFAVSNLDDLENIRMALLTIPSMHFEGKKISIAQLISLERVQPLSDEQISLLPTWMKRHISHMREQQLVKSARQESAGQETKSISGRYPIN